MESYFALLIALIIVVALAMALAAYNNRADEPAPKQERQQQKKNKKDKKSKAEKDVVPDEKDKKKKKKKRASQQAPVKFTWDGTVENEDESMIELLRGTSEHLAKEAKDELKKKVRAAATTVGQVAEKVTAKGKAASKKDEDEEFEYVLMKRKKVEDKTKSKKKADKAKEVKDAVPVAEGENVVPVASNAPTTGAKPEKEGRKKGFYKRGVFQSLREAANAEKLAKQQEEEEKANAREKGRKKESTNEEAEPAKDERKDKPAKPKKTEGEATTGDVNATQTVGPRQPQKPRREPREPREPKEPREAPPPPPRPLGGTFEAASLDDMLSAISTHYGPKPKQNFAKFPPNVLTHIFGFLGVKDIIALSRVNHFLNKVSRDDKLWRALCKKDFGIKFPKNQPKNQSRKKFKSIYKDEFQKRKTQAK